MNIPQIPHENQAQIGGHAMKVDISSITIGERHRKDMGDLNKLANSILDIGLLQPIGITNESVLVFGERRLRACRDIIGYTEIDVRIIDMPNIVVGEHAENEVRKSFTPTERVAIGRAIETELGNRHGNNRYQTLEVDNYPPLETDGKKSREVAAKKAGFGSEFSYRQAKYVVDNAEPEVIEAMDSNVISISQARKISNQEPEVQRKIIKSGKTIEDLERETMQEYRDYHSNEHPELKVQTITKAAIEIAACEMSPEQFKELAYSATMRRFMKVAPRVHAFTKFFVEKGANNG